ncbi:MAG: Nif3-like dinuclear metal center hexameric protein [Alistipes sp.]|jgi:dinuclear metal center YbgI/SA1388 family protein|nr:Nif3-like dinuclear metal center hexameric protein [Alistipes sp.]
MKIRDIVAPIEEFAPLALQEPYDNCGLVVGHPDTEVAGAVLCVDVTEEILDEAIALGAGLIIAHHPIIFHPLHSIGGGGHVDRVVVKAIRSGIAIYAAHTNLDCAQGGMSHRLARQLGLTDVETLDPTGGGMGFGMGGNAPNGAGGSNATDNATGGGTGFGAIGNLPEPVDPLDFLRSVARTLGTGCIRHTTPPTEKVRRVALSTGAGSEGLERAVERGADIFLTADVRYDRFFAAEGWILLADVGHFESEFCAIDLIHDVISKKIANFALHKSVCARNPVNYLTH